MEGIERKPDVLVVGAGIAGLIAATELQKAGRSVLVLDKGRGVGGRLATRRIEGATFDHGAQGFTTGNPRFTDADLPTRLAGAISEWMPERANGTEGPQHWRGMPSMSGAPRQLARHLDIHLESSVVALRSEPDHWMATTLQGGTLAAHAVILTPPVPQSLAILDAGNFPLPAALRQRLTTIEYDRCLTVMAALDGPSRIPPPGALWLSSGPLAAITDNQRKGISLEPAVTLQATAEFSLAHWDRDRTESGRFLLASAASWLGTDVKTFQVHGWRYSRPRVLDPAPCVLAHQRPPLVLAGDAFAGGGVEGAAHSGFMAARRILDLR